MSGEAAETELALRQRLKDELPHYAEACLKIRSKAGRIEPLVLNGVQRFIHERLEAQRKATGRVRALILKARQPGVSTYVGARFFWKVTHGRGLKAFILTHRDQATANLFAMAKRYYRLRQGGGRCHRHGRHDSDRRSHHS